MAVAIDLGEEKDIHPRNKQDVGKRLARAALGTVYDRAVVYSGPLYDGMKVEGDRIRVSFKHVGGGLEARGGKLAGFAVAGADRKFVWAEAEIDGETVVVRHPLVPAPVAVRYAWADNPEATLYNKEGLPASPFRTDDWPRAR
jgi:sialate O-acetylesterase